MEALGIYAQRIVKTHPPFPSLSHTHSVSQRIWTTSRLIHK